MSELDIDKVTRHLEAVLTKQRREAMTYTIATVLCTPAFVVVGSKEMQTAPSGFSRYNEYRQPLEPGAYVWCERGGVWRLV